MWFGLKTTPSFACDQSCKSPGNHAKSDFWQQVTETQEMASETAKEPVSQDVVSKKRALDNTGETAACAKRLRLPVPEPSNQLQSTLDKFFSHGSVSTPSSPALLYGIKLYTKEEIEAVQGLDRHYREFWNTKANELCGDKSVRAQTRNKTAIYGAINTSWLLQKSDYLQLMADELCGLAENAYKNVVDRDRRLKSIHKNCTNVANLTTTISVLYSELEDAKELAVHQQCSIKLLMNSNN